MGPIDAAVLVALFAGSDEGDSSEAGGTPFRAAGVGRVPEEAGSVGPAGGTGAIGPVGGSRAKGSVGPAGGVRTILTRRSRLLSSHSGEVAFPGGKIELGETAFQAACREASEEVGLDCAGAGARLIGYLSPQDTYSSGLTVLPIVVALAARPHLSAGNIEVERVFEVGLVDFLAGGVFRQERWLHPGTGEPVPVYFFDVAGEVVWGLTARIIVELLDLVAAA